MTFEEGEVEGLVRTLRFAVVWTREPMPIAEEEGVLMEAPDWAEVFPAAS